MQRCGSNIGTEFLEILRPEENSIAIDIKVHEKANFKVCELNLLLHEDFLIFRGCFCSC